MPLLNSISAILFSRGVKVPLEHADAKQVMWKPPVLRPLPQGLVGILSLRAARSPQRRPFFFCPLGLYHSDVVAFA